MSTSQLLTWLPAVQTRLEQGWGLRAGVPAQKRLSSNTVAQYLMIARRIDRDVVALLDPVPVVEAKLQQWRDDLERAYRAERVGASSIRSQVSALKCVYAALQVLGACSSNPALALGSVSSKRGLPRPMDQAQVERLFRAIDCTTADGRRDRALVELLLHSLRRAEVAGLTTDCLIPACPTHVVVRVFGKGETERLVPLHPAASLIIARYVLDEFLPNEWRNWLPDFASVTPAEQVLACLERALRTGLEQGRFSLFRQESGEAVSLRWINRLFVRYRDAAQLSKQFGPHSLRHTFGTELLAAGEDLRTVQELMGHGDIRSTTIYTKVGLSTQASATQKLPTPAVEDAWAVSL